VAGIEGRARDPSRRWVHTKCARCCGSGGNAILSIEDDDAPRGQAAVVRCARCDLRRLDPRPSAEYTASHYKDDYNSFVGRTRSSAKQWIWDLLRDLSAGYKWPTRVSRRLRRAAQRFTSRIVDINLALPADKEPLVLDVGCGYGDLLIYFKSRGCRVRGVEADRRAATKAAEYGIGVAIEDPSKISLPARCVDAAILCHSLEHLPDPSAVLKEIARVSRPGAELQIAVPNGDSAGLEVQTLKWGHLSYPLHFWYFDARNLQALLLEAGFEPEVVSYRMTWGFQWLTWRQEAARRGWRSVAGQIATLVTEVVRRPSRRDVLRVTARRLVES
jgi:SAM-dependent methyltransferase